MRALRQLIGHQYPKNIDEIIRESIKLRSPFQHFSTVIISDRDIIKGISQSKPNNLILDNFGIWLAGFFRAPVAATKIINLNDSGGTPRAIHVWEQPNAANLFNVDPSDKIGSLLQVGAGTTAATRADENVETAFGTAPEDDVFDSGTGVYAVGTISLSGALTAGGAGTINETCLFGAWVYGAGSVLANFLLFHDILVSGEAFVLGNTITVAYTINL